MFTDWLAPIKFQQLGLAKYWNQNVPCATFIKILGESLQTIARTFLWVAGKVREEANIFLSKIYILPQMIMKIVCQRIWRSDSQLA